MYSKKVTFTRSSKGRKTLWQTLCAHVGAGKGIAGLLVVVLVIGLVPVVTIATSKVVKADMISVLKRAFNGYSTSQNPITIANAANATKTSTGGTTPTCPTGQIILGMDTTTTPPTPKCGPPSALTNPTNHTWLCPAGQVESGLTGREEGAPVRCVPCPSGTVRMYVFGSESCQRPDFTPNYTSVPPGYQIGANGQICLADGQSYAGSFHPRYRSTQPNMGACCNGGYRDSQPVVAGSSVALFICGAGSAGGGSTGAGGGITPGNVATNLPGWEKKPDGTTCRSDGQSYAGAHNPRYKSTAAEFGECCNGGYIDPNPVVAGSSVHLFICGPNNGSRSSGGATSSIGVRVTGVLESASCTAVSGWAYDAANPGRVVTIDFYADGLMGTGRKIGSVTPRVLRNDINTQYRLTGTHGFSWSIPAGTFAAGSAHKMYAYAVESNNLLLTGSPLNFTCPAAANAQNQVTTTFQGGPPDVNPTFVISTPAAGSTVVGRSVSVSYYSTVELLPTDYAVLQLDSQTPVGINYSTGGAYQFNNVLPGMHTIRGYLARADGTKIPNTSTSTSFTVQ